MDLPSFIQFELTPRFAELVQAPFAFPDMVWMTLPLLVSTVFMQVYFGRYKSEKVGWNTALSNALVLIFVGIDSIRFLISSFGFPGILVPAALLKLGAVLLVLLYGLLLSIFDFFHKIPMKVAFIISSPATVNILAYLNLAVIYSSIPIDLVTIIAGAVLFVILFVVFHIIRWVTPSVEKS